MRFFPKTKISCACRGDGVAYIEIIGVQPFDSVRVSTDKGIDLPASVLSLRKNRYIIVFPLVKTSYYILKAANNSWSLSITSLELAFRSKFAYACNRAAALCLKNSDLDESATCLSIRFVQVINDGDTCIARARIDVPHYVSCEAAINATVVNAWGIPIDSKLICMEDCKSALDDYGRPVRRLIFSVRLSCNKHFIGIFASVSDRSCQPCGCMLLDDAYESLCNNFTDATMDAMHNPSYHRWWKRHKPNKEELCVQSAFVFKEAPKFSIVVPLFYTPLIFFNAMYASVLRQSYSNWELIFINASLEDSRLAKRLSAINDTRVTILETENMGIAENTNKGIKVAQGDYICFLDHDDMLAPNALYEYARAITLYSDIDLLYCDEDRFDARGRHKAPFFKPDFSPELLRAHNYITHFLCVSKTCVQRTGFMDAVFDGAQDYDYILRASENARKVFHVSQVLYHWRMHDGSTSVNSESKTYAKQAGLRAVRAHCERMGFKASVELTEMPFAYRVVRASRDWGCVDIVIPNKDHSDLLSDCLESILKLSTYQNYRIVIVENNSKEPETFVCYKRFLALDSRIRVVTWQGRFNYSKVVNFGAQQSKSSYILFLNNDTKVISPDFLESMLGYFEDQTVGVVGAKLLYADGSVQHAGVGVGLQGAAAHLFVSLPENAGGYFDRARLPQNLSAVTGACQLVKRSVYEQVGGYSEDFSIGYNDIDFCLKTIRAGYRIVYTPYALLNHYEFSSRGRDMRDDRMHRVEQETTLLHDCWPKIFEKGDPYLNSNLSSDSCYFDLGKIDG